MKYGVFYYSEISSETPVALSEDVVVPPELLSEGVVVPPELLLSEGVVLSPELLLLEGGVVSPPELLLLEGGVTVSELSLGCSLLLQKCLPLVSMGLHFPPKHSHIMTPH